jgi:uncharacterized membrane protein
VRLRWLSHTDIQARAHELMHLHRGLTTAQATCKQRLQRTASKRSRMVASNSSRAASTLAPKLRVSP